MKGIRTGWRNAEPVPKSLYIEKKKSNFFFFQNKRFRKPGSNQAVFWIYTYFPFDSLTKLLSLAHLPRLQQWAVHICPQVAYMPWVEQTRYQWNEQRLWMVLSEGQITKSGTAIGHARVRRGCHNFRHTGREGLRERGGNNWPYFLNQSLEHTDTSVHKEAQMTRRQWTCFIWRPNNGGGG